MATVDNYWKGIIEKNPMTSIFIALLLNASAIFFQSSFSETFFGDQTYVNAVHDKEISEMKIYILNIRKIDFESTMKKRDLTNMERIDYENIANELNDWQKKRTNAVETISNLKGTRSDKKLIREYYERSNK